MRGFADTGGCNVWSHTELDVDMAVVSLMVGPFTGLKLKLGN